MLNILNRLLRRRTSSAKVLVGCWHLVRSTQEPFEPAEADFRDDGRLYYSVLSRGRWQIMKLRYRVEGDFIVTEQPSAPRQERTRFSVESDGTLHLELGDKRNRFHRGDKLAPSV